MNLLIGPPRSGTTLLRRIINSHPDICCPPEPFLVSSCCKFARQHQVGYGLPAGPVSGLAFSDLDEEYLYAKLRALVHEIYADICAKHGKPGWVDKDGHAFAYLEEVDAIFGDHTRYIFIIRHGVDTAMSIEDLLGSIGAFPDVFHPYIISDPIILNAAARLWVDVARAIHGLRTKRPHATLLVHYEDLVQQPARECDRLYSFLGAAPHEFDPDTLFRISDAGLGDPKTYSTRTFTTGEIDKWRRLSAPVRNRLAEIVNDTLQLFEYEPLRVSLGPKINYRRLLKLGLGLKRTRALQQ